MPVIEKDIPDDEVLPYVIKAATLRRHLTASQRAMLAVKLEAMFAEDAKGRQGERTDLKQDDNIETDLSQCSEHECKSATQAGQAFGVSATTVKKAKKVAKVKPEKVEEIKAGKTTVDAVYRKINQSEKEAEAKAKLITSKTQAKIVLGDCVKLLDDIPNRSYDCLLTDPLYITDIEDFKGFTQSWLPKAFEKIKLTGRAFIFCSSHPEEISIYYDKLSQLDDFVIGNLLIWVYQNTIGPTPKMKFKNNWQGIFYLYGKNAPKFGFQFFGLFHFVPPARIISPTQRLVNPCEH